MADTEVRLIHHIFFKHFLFISNYFRISTLLTSIY